MKIRTVTVAAALVAATLLPGSAAADRGEQSRPPLGVELERRGCVTWGEFNRPPMDGVHIWGKSRIEREWAVRGLYSPERSTPGTVVYLYRKCGRVGFPVQVTYLDEPGLPWSSKSVPCPCSGLRG